jgi:hypothetical protein
MAPSGAEPPPGWFTVADYAANQGITVIRARSVLKKLQAQGLLEIKNFALSRRTSRGYEKATASLICSPTKKALRE